MPMASRWLPRLLWGCAVLIGLLALVDFDWFKRHLMFLSGDGSVEPHTFLHLRLVLLAFGTVGLLLFWRKQLLDLAARLAAWLENLPRPAFLAGLLIGALLVRLAVILFMGITLKSDSMTYNDLAIDWARSGSYIEAGKPTGYWPPGNPWFLSRLYLLFGELPAVAAVVNTLLNLVSLLLVYRMMVRSCTERTARLTALMVALLPSQVFFVTFLVSEHLFTLLLLLALWLILEADQKARGTLWQYGLAGAVLGLATLTRSVLMAFPAVLVIYWVMVRVSWRQILARTLLVVAGGVVVTAPWIVRNYQQVGAATISTTGGVNFYIGNNPQSGMGWSDIDTVLFMLHDPVYEAHNDSLGYALGWQYIREHPVAFVKRAIMKVGYLYVGDVDAVVYQLMDSAKYDRFDIFVLIGWLMQTTFFLLLLASGAGLLRYCRMDDWRSGFLLLLLVVGYWTALHAVFFGAGRFHYPIVPMLAAFAALYVVQGSGVGEARRRG
jgi:4-amino-4-deoxy-L-arabinose transferase-like glycosyltransferase